VAAFELARVELEQALAQTLLVQPVELMPVFESALVGLEQALAQTLSVQPVE
jgi:hypothetical protein